MSVISGRTGAFAYDLGCAIAIAAAALSLAGLFSRNYIGLLTCAAAFIVSPVYEFSQLGFLGKIIGFPASVLLAGMYFKLARADLDDDLHSVAIYAGIGATAAAAGMMFSGYITVLVLVSLGGCYLLLELFEDRHTGWKALPLYVRPAAILVALAVVIVLSYGVATRPLYVGFLVIETPWKDLWYEAMGVTSVIPSLADLPDNLVAPLALFLPLMALAIVALSLRASETEAASLVLGATAIGIMLFVKDERWRFLQTVPMYIPVLLCAAAALSGRLHIRNRALPIFPIGALLLGCCLAIGAYRAKPISDKIAGGPLTPATYVFSEHEISGLADKIKKTGGVTIDVGPSPHLNIFALAELGGRGAGIQLSEASWKIALAYRIWKYPGEKPYPLRLVLTSPENSSKPNLLYRTAQFDLLGPAPAAP
jgi:hypothetical protein